ncbi:hypothetical protein [Polaromonas sp. JS666]|uniref:hypothetical protein n=1 Tax=Polaromonas sp. (strain JS666 / ATCC BAA-500) TaxID=296591 RepID=UPI0000534A28|nr:hypothetical protein [Polaromonas sp. JS666]ABE44918.1 hypothetical protein Bpro_3004 [Polaromonas sp. JS666]
MDEKTRFYVPDSVQHHTKLEWHGLFSCRLRPLPQENLMGFTEQITQNTQTEQNQQTHQNHQPDLGRQTSQTNQSDRKDQQASHPQAGNAPWPPFQGQRQDGSTRS